MDSKSCRLCSTSNTDPFLDIFSKIGIELEMVHILSEHFKCDITETDPLPNVVCQRCWTTTDAFHELYKKSKVVQETFFNSSMKIRHEPVVIVWPADSKENKCIVEEMVIEINPIKVEQSSGDSGSDNEPLIDDIKEENLEIKSNEEIVDEYDCKNDSEHKSQNKTPKRKQWQTKKKNKEYQKIFSENNHLFDMSCDCCAKIFESLEEARKHYSSDHNNPRGYIKCCGRRMFYRCQVVQHVTRHLNPDKFKCMQCDRLFWCNFELERHKKQHQAITENRLETFPCDICKKVFSKPQNLRVHKRRHKNDPPDTELYDQFIAENFDMSCDQCDGKLTSFYDAQRHYKDIHNEDNGYLKCCGKKLKKLSLIRDHINTHLNPDFFKCDSCSKTFTTRQLLIGHKLQHRLTLHKPYQCDYCKKMFRSKGAVTRHLFSNHVNAEPKFECQICNKKFQLQSLLKSHMYAVHREKKTSVTCEVCGKSFYAKFFLDKHMLTHTDKSERLAMRKQCEHCGEWLMTKSGIYYHKQLHTTGIQKCDQCEMELPNKLALKRHILEYHRAHKFKCSYCVKTFSTGSDLRRHEESHTRHKTYQCKFCPKVFTVSNSLRTHTQRNHKEEVEMSKQIENLTRNFPLK